MVNHFGWFYPVESYSILMDWYPQKTPGEQPAWLLDWSNHFGFCASHCSVCDLSRFLNIFGLRVPLRARDDMIVPAASGAVLFIC